MQTSAESNRREGPAWEGQEDFLEFLSGVQGEVERAGNELGADFRLDVAPPESIDGDQTTPHTLSFFISLGKSGFPALSYCLYTRLDLRALRAFAGQYEAGKVKTIRELERLHDLKGAPEALKGWLRELFRLSLGKKSENT